MGIRLRDIPDVRRLYSRDPFPPPGGVNHDEEEEPIDFTRERVHSDGHVIAARITAENPDEVRTEG